MSIDSTVGTKLFNIRTGRGETQEEVAESVGISYVSLSRYKTGRRMPKMNILARLAEHYGVTVDELIGRDEAETKKAEPITSTSPQIVMMARAMEQMTPEQRDTMLNLGRAAFAQYFGINDENT